MCFFYRGGRISTLRGSRATLMDKWLLDYKIIKYGYRIFGYTTGERKHHIFRVEVEITLFPVRCLEQLNQYPIEKMRSKSGNELSIQQTRINLNVKMRGRKLLKKYIIIFK